MATILGKSEEMVINRIADRKPGWKEREAAEEKCNMTENERKELLLEELKKERSDILCLALMYAKNFEELGYDTTRCIITANQNSEILEAAYKKGFDDGITKGRTVEREQIEKNYKLVRHDNPYISNNDCFDSYFGTNTVQRPSGDLVQSTNVQSYGKGKRKRHRR